jgi:hypothetical protein
MNIAHNYFLAQNQKFFHKIFNFVEEKIKSKLLHVCYSTKKLLIQDIFEQCFFKYWYMSS